MNIMLSPATQKLLEAQMKTGKFASPDEALHTALQVMIDQHGEDIEDLDEETQASLERAFAQSAQGQGQPWSEVRSELKKRYFPQE